MEKGTIVYSMYAVIDP